MIVLIVAYLATFGTLGAYALSVRKQNPRIFDWGNAIFFIPLTTVNLIAEAPWAALISFVFGMIGCVSLVKNRKEGQWIARL